jgi:hypothetical protein
VHHVGFTLLINTHICEIIWWSTVVNYSENCGPDKLKSTTKKSLCKLVLNSITLRFLVTPPNTSLLFSSYRNCYLQLHSFPKDNTKHLNVPDIAVFQRNLTSIHFCGFLLLPFRFPVRKQYITKKAIGGGRRDRSRGRGLNLYESAWRARTVLVIYLPQGTVKRRYRIWAGAENTSPYPRFKLK